MKTIIFACIFLPFLLMGNLKENLAHAEKGDFVVVSQGKSYTLFLIADTADELLTIEEITIPEALANQCVPTWKRWVQNGAPQNSSWIRYQIDLKKSVVKNYFSYTKNSRFSIPEADNFLATLMKLELKPIPDAARKKVGSRKSLQKERAVWQPAMVVDGEAIEGVVFDAYSTIWPKDGGPLSGKLIEIYLPHDSGQYPAYFPYWLQVKGMGGQATVRVVDSGKGLSAHTL